MPNEPRRARVALLAQPETEYDRSVRNRRRDEALGERGRRVLEDAGAEEGRRDPDRCECRNFPEDDCGLRRAEDRWRVSLLVLPGGDQGDGALVIRRTCVGVEPCVQLRQSRETQGEDQGRKQTSGDDGTEFFAAAHVDRDSVITSTFPQGNSSFQCRGRRSDARDASE
jgi:hypothetical protein